MRAPHSLRAAGVTRNSIRRPASCAGATARGFCSSFDDLKFRGWLGRGVGGVGWGWSKSWLGTEETFMRANLNKRIMELFLKKKDQTWHGLHDHQPLARAYQLFGGDKWVDMKTFKDAVASNNFSGIIGRHPMLNPLEHSVCMFSPIRWYRQILRTNIIQDQHKTHTQRHRDTYYLCATPTTSVGRR